MKEVLIQSLTIALSGLFSFGSISIVLLLLSSTEKGYKGLIYSLGYLLSYIIIGIILIFFSSSSENLNNLSDNSYFKIFLVLLGLLMIFLGIRNIFQSKRDKPGLFTKVQSISMIKCFLLGLLVPIINFKNFILYSSSIAVVALNPLVITKKMALSVMVSSVFSFSVFIPVIIYHVFPKRSEKILNGIKSFIEKYKRLVSIIIPIVIGLAFIIRGGFG